MFYSKDVLVMTPNALLNLLYRGKKYLSLSDVGVLVFDECHQARKKHPYARVMTFYMELKEQGGSLPKVIKGLFIPPPPVPGVEASGLLSRIIYFSYLGGGNESTS